MKTFQEFFRLPPGARWYIFGLSILAAGITALALRYSPAMVAPWPTFVLCVVAIAVSHLISTPSRGHSYVLSGPFVVATALILAPAQALLAVSLGLFPGEFRTTPAWYKKMFNYSLYISGAMLASIIFHTLSPTSDLLAPASVPYGVVASAVFTLTNLVALAVVVSLTQGYPIRSSLGTKQLLANLAFDGSGLAVATLWRLGPEFVGYALIPLVAGAYALWLPVLEEELRQDAKTGVYNGRFAVETLHRLYREHEESGSPLSVIMVDIDNLRETNNRYGHLMGDVALQAVAAILKAEGEDLGYVARFGGEEFLIILPGRTPEDAALLGEKARMRIRTMRLRHPQSIEEASITVSLGVSDQSSTDQSATELLHRADNALYEAKRLGRDRVVVRRALAVPPRTATAPPEREKEYRNAAALY